MWTLQKHNKLLSFPCTGASSKGGKMSDDPSWGTCGPAKFEFSTVLYRLV